MCEKVAETAEKQRVVFLRNIKGLSVNDDFPDLGVISRPILYSSIKWLSRYSPRRVFCGKLKVSVRDKSCAPSAATKPATVAGFLLPT